jgi:hypothetical protein
VLGGSLPGCFGPLGGLPGAPGSRVGISCKAAQACAPTSCGCGHSLSGGTRTLACRLRLRGGCRRGLSGAARCIVSCLCGLVGRLKVARRYGLVGRLGGVVSLAGGCFSRGCFLLGGVGSLGRLRRKVCDLRQLCRSGSVLGGLLAGGICPRGRLPGAVGGPLDAISHILGPRFLPARGPLCRLGSLGGQVLRGFRLSASR